MVEDGASESLPAGSAAQSYWGSRRGTTIALLAMIGIGVLLLSIGLLNEARIRPYQYYYNCVEYTDIEDFTWTDCECEPPEYEVYLGLAIVGSILALIGGGLLANLVYHHKRPSDASPD